LLSNLSLTSVFCLHYDKQNGQDKDPGIRSSNQINGVLNKLHSYFHRKVLKYYSFNIPCIKGPFYYVSILSDVN